MPAKSLPAPGTWAEVRFLGSALRAAMFHYDKHLHLTRLGIAVDARTRQRLGFVSHAHADHMARHVQALATPATGALYRHRLGKHLRVLEMPYHEPLAIADYQLTALPAGHCLGSAMLLVDDGRQRLLVTGDFRLGPTLTAGTVQIPQADILIIESTFGRPKYRLPPRDEVIRQLITEVQTAIADEVTPVIHAYALGKSQEVTALLTTHEIPVLQHPTIWGVSQVYQACGVTLGSATAPVASYDPGRLAGAAVVTLPVSMKGWRLRGLQRVRSIAVTGWAVEPSCKHRQQVDIALPLSDHADFDQLLEMVAGVGASEVLCTHGHSDFVGHLVDRGYNARSLVPEPQRRLF